MTESNITKEHEGKHGVLTLGGSHNDVTITTIRAGGSFGVRIDGTEVLNGFYLDDGWQFTPDLDHLPTEPGWYVPTSNRRGDLGTPVFYFLGVDTGWYQNTGLGTYSMPGSTMVELHARDPLVRVSFGVAS